MTRTIPSRLLIVITALMATACASTTLTNSWRAADYTGTLTSLMVVGVSKQASVRRVFEDEFVLQLRGRGIEAVSSYTLLPNDGPVAAEQLREAVDTAGTDAVIITRLVRVDKQVAVTPATPTPMHRPYYYGYYSNAWVGYYEPATVHQYDVVTAETTVFVRDRAEPVWSGTTETFAPENLRKETAAFAATVMKALADDGLI